MNERDERSVRHQHIDSKMINRLRIYMVVAIIMLISVAYEVLLGTITIQLAILGIVGGLIIGAIVGRMFRLNWDEDTSTVIGYVDWIGAVILIIYLIFIFARAQYLGLALILSITAGTMLGRVLSTRHNLNKILRAWKII
jgi:uncharacterized membrane protein YagU involved in acid resistance